MITIRPDQEKVKKFLIAPLAFGFFACAITIMSLGFDLTALIYCALILIVVCLPFIILILPVFLREKIVIEDFTSTFWFVFLWMKFKKVIHIKEIKSIEEDYRDGKRSGPKIIKITTAGEHGNDVISLSEMKYRRIDILEMIRAYQEKNPKIHIHLLDK